MKPAKITVVYYSSVLSVTGGQKYECNLFDVIRSLPETSLEIIPTHSNRSFFTKLCAPIKSLFLYPRIKDSDAILFNSSSFLYFLPLMFLLKMLSRNTFVIHHHFIYNEFSGLKRKIIRKLEASYLKCASHRISPSPYVRQLMLDKNLGDTILWPIPFDPPSFSGELTPVAGNLLYVGTIEPRKGLTYLLDAMILLANRKIDCRLRIIGKVVDRDYYARLQESIRQNNLDVEFLGFVSKERKESEFKNSDIFVFPSLLEGFGMVLAEAQAFSLPIVAFDNSAMPLTVKHCINGFLCRNMNSGDMADNIARIVTDRQLRSKLAAGALENARNAFSQTDLKELVTRDIDNYIRHK